MSVFGKFNQYINASLDSRIDDLKKSEPLAKAVKEDGIGRKGLLFDPFNEAAYAGGLFRQKNSFLSNGILKQVARRNAFVASIVDTRAGQVMSACKRPSNRFDMGFKFTPKNKDVKLDPQKTRKAEEFLLNCGNTEDRASEDKLTFDNFGYMLARDLMIYGHCAIEKVPRRDGNGLGAFLPLPGETIYYANKRVKQETIEQMRDTWRKGVDEKVNVDDLAQGEKYEWVQVIDGKVVEGFTRDEMVFAKFNMESDVELRGYAVGPLERSISAITSHLQIENHQRQFFSHGIASRGVLVIQGDVTPNTLKAFQAQWTQQITGPMNAWRTPIIAGVEQVQWVDLSASNRDMEFAAYQDHILRTICACFAIDPEEVGFGYLSKGTEQKSLSESSNEWKVTASRDRGLRPLLGRLEAIINEEILPAYDKDFSNDYHFTFVGLDAETEMEETERLQAETALHTTLDEAREQTERQKMAFGGSLLLNPTWIQTVMQSIPFGQWVETFMGISGASQRPDLQFFANPMWFQWQTMMQQMMMQQAAAQQQQEGGAEGQEGQEGQEDQEQGDQEQGSPSNKDQAEGEEGDEQQQQQQQDPQVMANAVNAYIESNPELFKALKKQQGGELYKSMTKKYSKKPLRKSEKKPKQIKDKHVEEMRDELVKDFRRSSGLLLKQIIGAIREDAQDE